MAVEALTIGARAARLLSLHTDWAVAATFDRSFYLRSGDAFVCVGDASIGNGPLNILMPLGVIPALIRFHPRACPEDPSSNALEALGPHSLSQRFPANPSVLVEPWVLGTSPRMTAVGGLATELPGGTIISWRTSNIWRSNAMSTVKATALLPNRLNAIVSEAAATTPSESFIHALASKAPHDALSRRACTGIASLRRAMAKPSAGDFETAVTTLAGLGHGLTPSGDDVFAGALLMLHARGQTERAGALADAVRRIAPARTSPLSYALLEPACEGEPNEAIAKAITAVLADKPPPAVIAPLSAIGATSGFDMLAGMLIAAGL